MIRFAWKLRAMTVIGTTAALVCLTTLLPGPSTAQTGAATRKYTEPRYPSYLRPVKTVNDLMPNARALVRNKAAALGLGMGVAKQGETTALVTSAGAEDMAIQAIQKAFVERGVKIVIVPEYELAGVTKQDVADLAKINAENNSDRFDSENFSGGTGWFQSLPDPEKAKAW